MLKLKFLILFITTLELISFSQDTINFRAFDSLKTLTEDRHKGLASDTSGYILMNKKIRIFKEPDNFDTRLFRSINSSRSPFKDVFFNTITHSVLPVSAMLPSSLFFYGRTQRKHYDENSGYLLGGALTVNTIITMGTKIMVKRERPCDCLNDVYSRKEFADNHSFPSAHASFSFTSATMFALRYPKYPEVYAPMFAWAILTAYSRPYLGMHFPSDVLAGAVIGAGSSILVYSIRKELFTLKNNVLNEDINDEGSIKGGTVTFFAGSFLLSTIVSNFILKSNSPERMNLSTGFDEDGGRLNFNVRF